MRRLILLRHAKSTWPDNVADRDRPLAERGLKAASRIAGWLVRSNIVPDFVLVSPALRTLQTWNIIREKLPPRIPFAIDERLYEATAGGLLSRLREMTESVKSLMVIGHNPGLQELAEVVLQENDSEMATALREKFPTGSAAIFDVDIEGWDVLGPKQGKLQHFITPKLLQKS